MQITHNILLYWLRRKWPRTVAVRASGDAAAAGRDAAGGSNDVLGEAPVSAGNVAISRVMFWGSPNDMRGNLVVLEEGELAQVSKRYPGTVFLCVGCGDPAQCRPGNDYILLPDSDRVGKVFNYLGNVFEKFDRWGEVLAKASRDFLSYDAMIKSCEMIVNEPMALIDSDLHYVS